MAPQLTKQPCLVVGTAAAAAAAATVDVGVGVGVDMASEVAVVGDSRGWQLWSV